MDEYIFVGLFFDLFGLFVEVGDFIIFPFFVVFPLPLNFFLFIFLLDDLIKLFLIEGLHGHFFGVVEVETGQTGSKGMGYLY